MFTIYCEGCGARTLVWPSQVDGIRNTESGILVRFHCSAGHHGAFVTGRLAERQPEPALAVPA